MKILTLVLTAALFLTNCAQNKQLTFVVTADMRNFSGDNPKHFRGACEAMKNLKDSIQFVVSPGDIDPPDSVLYTLQKYFNKNVVWYPVVGNHEKETPSDIAWLRKFNPNGNTLPNITNLGPKSCKETNYSFEYGNTHFVVLNQYCNDTSDIATDGNITDVLYHWLENDLKNNKKKNVIVFGHEPAYPMPDIENQRFRHIDDCLNKYPANRDKFVKLLETYNVNSYIFGHTHNYSIVKINKLWHMDVGHARGTGDKGARSTFIKMNIHKKTISYETYRLNLPTGIYELTETGTLN